MSLPFFGCELRKRGEIFDENSEVSLFLLKKRLSQRKEVAYGNKI
jgi:hypothetical protein